MAGSLVSFEIQKWKSDFFARMPEDWLEILEDRIAFCEEGCTLGKFREFSELACKNWLRRTSHTEPAINPDSRAMLKISEIAAQFMTIFKSCELNANNARELICNFNDVEKRYALTQKERRVYFKQAMLSQLKEVYSFLCVLLERPVHTFSNELLSIWVESYVQPMHAMMWSEIE
jgi:hypothetical protein